MLTNGMYAYYGVVRTQHRGDLYINLRKMILGANFTKIVIAKDLRIPNEKETIMGWSGRKYG